LVRTTAIMAAILGSKGGWLSSLARRVASKKQQEQHLDADGAAGAAGGSHHPPAIFVLPSELQEPAAGASAPGASGPCLSISIPSFSGASRPALRRLPSDAVCADLALNKSPKPEEQPTGYRAWYLLLREKDDMKDMNEGWAPRRGTTPKT